MKFSLALILTLASASNTLATWSIIMVDERTKEIGIAAASCSPNCYGIGTIIPSLGAVIVQAMSNNEARARGIELMKQAYTHEQIIAAMLDPQFDPERQQYAVITLKDPNGAKTYTGLSTHPFNGAITGKGISVQGNTLTNETVLQAIYDAAVKGQEEGLPIDQVLMLALQAGSDSGGDARCGEQRATSAFIIVTRPGDKKPYIDLRIFGQWKGGPNAVTLLRRKYDKRRE